MQQAVTIFQQSVCKSGLLWSYALGQRQEGRRFQQIEQIAKVELIIGPKLVVQGRILVKLLLIQNNVSYPVHAMPS